MPGSAPFMPRLRVSTFTDTCEENLPLSLLICSLANVALSFDALPLTTAKELRLHFNLIKELVALWEGVTASGSAAAKDSWSAAAKASWLEGAKASWSEEMRASWSAAEKAS